MTVLIKNCTVSGEIADVYISDGKITEISRNIGKSADEIIQAEGLTLSFGFLDMHCHLRDPGLTHKEDIESGLRAAAKGGYTSVMAMPNTSPAADSEDVIKYEIKKASELKGTKLYPVGAVTKALAGEEKCNYRALLQAGAIAFSDDGNPVSDSNIMKSALGEINCLGSFMISHCETKELNVGGAVTPESEETMIERDCSAALELGAKVHIAHVSTKAGADIVRRYKALNAPVTAETCPHYFCFSADDVNGTDFKMNPPLRSERDRNGIIEGLLDGTIDVISTDHAPHAEFEKAVDYEKAPNGILGFETAFAAAYTYLVKTGLMPVEALFRKMAARPYEITGIKGGHIAVGEPADLVLIDLDKEFEYTKEEILSKSKNSPFIGARLFGRVKYTIASGRIIYREQ